MSKTEMARDAVGRYLCGQLDLDELSGVLVMLTAGSRADDPDADLAAKADASFWTFQSGHLTFDEFRREMADLLEVRHAQPA
jgi:hypothetical protein